MPSGMQMNEIVDSKKGEERVNAKISVVPLAECGSWVTMEWVVGL